MWGLKKWDVEIKLNSFCTLHSVFTSPMHILHILQSLSVWHCILELFATAACKCLQTCAPSVMCQSVQLSGSLKYFIWDFVKGLCCCQEWPGWESQYGRTEEERCYLHFNVKLQVSPNLWIPEKPQAVYGVWSQLMFSSVAEETELLFARWRVGLSNPPEITGGNYRSEMWAWGSAGMPREQQHKQEQPSWCLSYHKHEGQYKEPSNERLVTRNWWSWMAAVVGFVQLPIWRNQFILHS